MSFRTIAAAASIAAGIATAWTAPAAAAALKFGATLSGQNEVPPIQSPASGVAKMSYDPATRTLTWNIRFEKLSAPLRAGHIHGAASASQNAPVMIPVGARDADSPLVGSAVITPEQAEGLMAGRLYVNLHTAAFPPGEIRGQLVRR